MRVNHPANGPAANTTSGNEAGSPRSAGRNGAASSTGAQSPVQGQSTRHNETAQAGREAVHEGAKPEISAKSKEFAQAKAIATDAPDIRESKVADIKKRIAEGNYHVDHEAVADRLVDDHLKMSET